MSNAVRIRLLLIAIVALLAVVTASGAAASLPISTGSLLALEDTGTLTFQAELPVRYPPTPCPAGIPGVLECFARTGTGIIRGLGSVDESYAYLVENLPAGCDPSRCDCCPRQRA